MTDAIGCPICRSEAAQIDRVPSMVPGSARQPCERMRGDRRASNL